MASESNGWGVRVGKREKAGTQGRFDGQYSGISDKEATTLRNIRNKSDAT